MADLANFKIKVDSTDVRKGAADLDQFSNVAKTSVASIDRLYASQKRLADAYASSDRAVIQSTKYLDQIQREISQVGKSALQLKALEIRMAAAQAPTEALAADIRKVGAELIRAERNAAKSSGGMMQLGKSHGLAAHHTQNLAFQLQDVVVGLQGGQRPLTVLMQQGSQIGGIMMQAGMGVGAMTKAILGMIASATRALLVNPIFLAIAAAATLGAAAISALNSEVNKSSEVENYAKSIGLTAEQIEEAGGAGVTAGDYIKGLWMTISEGLNLSGIFDTLKGWFVDLGELVLTVGKNAGAGLYAAFAGSFNAIKIIWGNLPAVLGDLFTSAVNKALSGVEWLTNKIIEGINKLAGAEILNSVKFTRLVNENAGAANKAAGDIARGYTEAFDQAIVALEAFGDKVAANAVKAAKARLDAAREEKKVTGSEPKVDQATKQAEDFAAALEKEAEQIGKTAIEIKKMGVEAAIAAAPTEELKNRIREAGAAWERATRAQARKDFESNILQPLRNELELVGLTGDARARKQLELEKEAFQAKAAADGIEDVNKAWEEYRDLKTQIIDKESLLEKEAKEAEKLKKELGQVGGFLDMVKSGFGRKVEVVISNILKMSPDLKNQFKDIFKDLRKALDDVLASLGTDLKKVAAGAAIGGIAGGVTGSKLGGAIGGGIGQGLGEQFLPMLGKFAGPLGAIAGGLLGGVIGGMVKSTPRASATIETIAGDAVVAGVRGNKGQLKTMAEGLAGSMIKGLQAIADEFSGTIAAGIKISIGVRKDTFRVDPLGLGRTKGMPSFKTEEEAIQYAIKLALERGAIEGIRESTKRLLQAGDDLQAALQDALDFEGVFDRLLEKTDPLAFGLKELEKEFERLNKVFEKAGASTEEFADLQRLYDLERAEILKEEQQRQMDEANKINELIMRIYREQGKEAEELALTRKMERDAASEAERAILDQIYALEDFNKARVEEVSTLEDTIATMTQLAASLRSFRDGLYGADQSVTNYKQALVDLIRVGSLASTGDVEALGQLQGVSQTFLAASKARAGSLFEYQKDVALVASYVDQGIAAADEQVSAAEQQIDLLQKQLDELVNISALLTEPSVPDVAIEPSWNANIAGGGGGNSGAFGENTADMENLLRDALYNIAKHTGNTAKLLDRWDGDGQPDIRELQSDYY